MICYRTWVRWSHSTHSSASTLDARMSLKVNRPRPGRGDEREVLGQMVDSVQDEGPCIIVNRIKAGPCGSPASV